ncbi:MAG TPA: hypothetical protein VMV22_04435 [Acidimicrobiales bacterium]|nr:hypothetical protein [Acidimicrobiales bacterium]
MTLMIPDATPLEAEPPGLALRRLHLRSVGPDEARSDPLDLALTTPEGAASARSLLALTNTGGKTTLITLACSVLVTAAKHQVGKANIGEYVQSGDTAHVVLEWEATGVGRFVTGAVYEWPNRTRPGGVAPISDLKRAWYTFRSEELGIDDLPFNTDARTRRTLEDFRARTEEVFAARPSARFIWTSQQGEWARVLDEQTPLDPELFRYQMRMNDQEGGAGALVKRFTSGEEVVRFFVEVLNDIDAIGAFTTTLREYAASSAQRRDWEVEAVFCGAMVEHLEALGSADRRLRDARTAERDTGYRGAELAAALTGRADNEDRAAKAIEERVETQGAEVTALTATVRRNEDVRSQLRLELARFEVAAAEERLATVGAQLEAAAAERDAWQAVGPVQRLANAHAVADAARRDYESAEGELAPLRARVDAVGAALAAKHAALAAEADERVTAAEADVARHAEEAERAERARTAALEARGAARQELSAITAAETAARTALGALVSAGDAKRSERAADAEARWERTVGLLREREASAGEQLDAADIELAALAPRLETARATLDEARRRRDTLTERKTRYLDDIGRLNADEAVRAEAGGEITDVAMASRVAEGCATRAAEAEREAADRDAEVQAIDRELAPLESGDMLVTVDDIETLCRALTDGGIGAVTGWHWLAHHDDPTLARRVIEAHPELANGIVVTDPARLAEALALLEGRAERPRLAVVVSAGELAQIAADRDREAAHDRTSSPTRGVVEPHRALWDPAWAQRTADELRDRRRVAADRAGHARAAATSERRVAAELTSFVGRWNAEPHDALVQQIHLEEAAVADADAEVARLRAATGDAEGRRAGATRSLREVGAEMTDAIARGERARAAAVREAAATTAGARRAGVVDAQERAQRDERAATDAGRDARAAAARAQETAATARAEGRAARRDQAEVGIEPASAVPATPLPELTATLRALREELTEAERGSDHADRLDRTSREVADARAVVDTIDATARATASEYLGMFEASNATLLAHRVADAEEEHRRQLAVKARADQDHADAVRTLAERSPEDRQVHVTLPTEWVPADAQRAGDLLERVNDLLAVDRERLSRLASTLDRSKADLADARRAAEDFLFVATSWLGPADDTITAPAFVGGKDDATAALSVCAADWQAAGRELAMATEARSAAHSKVRTTAASRQYGALVSTLRDRCQSAEIDDVAPQADTWARDARIRAAGLAADLADLDRHRAILVGQLESMCDAQLRMLREVTRCSQMPEGLGELSGKPAFRIDFDRAPAPDVHGKLAARVDEWAQYLAADPKRRPEPTRWLADALRDTVRSGAGGGWRVQVLKPSVDFALAYRSPDRIEREYSGGQELTLAVLLYCTLARVRAQNRTSRARPPGVLIADNPFGAASNPALIRMQQALAARAGIQLVCATGLDDPAVLTSFEGPRARVLRLRNDRDQRRGLHYLRVDDPELLSAVRASVLGDHGEQTDNAFLSATGYTVAADLPTVVPAAPPDGQGADVRPTANGAEAPEGTPPETGTSG